MRRTTMLGLVALALAGGGRLMAQQPQATDQLVVTSAGTTSEIWHAETHDTERVFYLEASMSLSSARRCSCMARKTA